jgi:hypothetical protein
MQARRIEELCVLAGLVERYRQGRTATDIYFCGTRASEVNVGNSIRAPKPDVPLKATSLVPLCAHLGHRAGFRRSPRADM